jgi:hypothetical protein
MKTGLRQALIGVALAATLAAVFLVQRQEQAERVAEPTKGRVAAKTGRMVASAGQARFGEGAGDLFPARSWQPPPPPAPVAAPSAPPLPYEFKGRLEEAGQTRIFLARQQSMLVVKQGDVLEGLYRVDAITPWSVEFTYLPLKQKQSLGFSK